MISGFSLSPLLAFLIIRILMHTRLQWRQCTFCLRYYIILPAVHAAAPRPKAFLQLLNDLHWVDETENSFKRINLFSLFTYCLCLSPRFCFSWLRAILLFSLHINTYIVIYSITSLLSTQFSRFQIHSFFFFLYQKAKKVLQQNLKQKKNKNTHINFLLNNKILWMTFVHLHVAFKY